MQRCAAAARRLSGRPLAPAGAAVSPARLHALLDAALASLAAGVGSAQSEAILAKLRTEIFGLRRASRGDRGGAGGVGGDDVDGAPLPPSSPRRRAPSGKGP